MWKPSGSLRGEKSPPALGALTLEFAEHDGPVDGFQRAFGGVQLTGGPTSGACSSWGLLGHHRLHLPLLNHPAELLPQFMGAQLDDRIVRHPLNRPIGSIEPDRDFGRFSEQTRQFVLQIVDLPLHGNAPNPRKSDPQTTKFREPYHKSPGSSIDDSEDELEGAEADVHPVRESPPLGP